jgi:hypothetical protein
VIDKRLKAKVDRWAETVKVGINLDSEELEIETKAD